MRFLLSAIVAFCVSTAAVAADKNLKLAATEWPPFYGADLENNGFVSAIIREAFERAGYTIDISFLPWKRAMAGTESGKFDGLFTMWYRADREESFAFSDALPANEYVFFKRKDTEIEFTSLDALTSHTVGMVRGYAPPETFDQSKFTVSLANTDEDNLKKLIRGRVDLVLTDKIVAQHIINTALGGEGAELEVFGEPLGIETQHFVMSKQAQDYASTIDAFNTALASMEEDGTLGEILASYGF